MHFSVLVLFGVHFQTRPPGEQFAALFASKMQDRVCLLDMEAEEALTPEDAARFDIMVHARWHGYFGPGTPPDRQKL